MIWGKYQEIWGLYAVYGIDLWGLIRRILLNGLSFVPQVIRGLFQFYYYYYYYYLFFVERKREIQNDMGNLLEFLKEKGEGKS